MTRTEIRRRKETFSREWPCDLRTHELWSNSSTPSEGPVITHNSSIPETYSLSHSLSTLIASSNNGDTILKSPLHSLFPFLFRRT